MNWQCPRCETFNPAAIKYCEVCELAKPPKRVARKTVTKKNDLAFVKPPGKTRDDSAAKPLETFKPVVKAIDHRPGSATTKPAEATPVILKSPVPPASLTPADVRPNKGGVIDGLSGMALVGFNIYFLYDFIAVQKLGIGPLILGMVSGNVVLILIIGAIAAVLKRLLNPPDSTK